MPTSQSTAALPTLAVGVPTVRRSPAETGVILRKGRVEHGGEGIPADLTFGATGVGGGGSRSDLGTFGVAESKGFTGTDLEPGSLTFHRVVHHGRGIGGNGVDPVAVVSPCSER